MGLMAPNNIRNCELLKEFEKLILNHGNLMRVFLDLAKIRCSSRFCLIRDISYFHMLRGLHCFWAS